MCMSTPMQNLTCKEVPSVTSAPPRAYAASSLRQGLACAPTCMNTTAVTANLQAAAATVPRGGEAHDSGAAPASLCAVPAPSGRSPGAGTAPQPPLSVWNQHASLSCDTAARSAGSHTVPAWLADGTVPLGHSALRSSPTQRRLSRPPARRSTCLCPDRNPTPARGVGGAQTPLPPPSPA